MTIREKNAITIRFSDETEVLYNKKQNEYNKGINNDN